MVNPSYVCFSKWVIGILLFAGCIVNLSSEMAFTINGGVKAKERMINEPWPERNEYGTRNLFAIL